nr:PREDICTED: uncharacterized protein LOC108194419 [Daucus carota subsp. sativus]
MASALQQHILTAPYGSWASPITSDLVLASGKTLGGFTLGSNANLLWLESRPSESGRSAIVREAEKVGEEAIDVTPKGFSLSPHNLSLSKKYLPDDIQSGYVLQGLSTVNGG